MQTHHRSLAGLIFLLLYSVAGIGIGWLSRRRDAQSNAYLNASRSLPLWVVTAAYLAANCGALEIVGLSAMAAQYGVQAMHFYLIGAIPALIFLALWMMPVYRRSGARSVPEYLEQRYGAGVKLLNAGVQAVITLLLAGVSLYAMAQVLLVVAGVHFGFSVAVAGGIVLTYVLLGGVRATIYNEVFQLAVMLGGLAPLAFRSYFVAMATPSGGVRDHLWRGVPLARPAAPFDVLGLIFGLGFVLSFGYWSTDFVQMQRAFAARTETEARMVPLWAGFGKLVFSLLVILPGLAAYRMFPALGHGQRFDQALPLLMATLYGPALLGLGLTTLAASLMSSLAANVSAFAALWTEDIYRARLVRGRSEAHYLRMGRVSAFAAVALGASSSYLNFYFGNLMEHIQLIFSLFGAPFWAIFLLGMGTRRTSARGAVAGFLAGTAAGLLHLAAVSSGALHYGSVMSSNFYRAVFTFLVALAVAWFSSITIFAEPGMLPGTRLLFERQDVLHGRATRGVWVLSGLLLLAFGAWNFVWR